MTTILPGHECRPRFDFECDDPDCGCHEYFAIKENERLRVENERLCVEVATLLDIINCVHEALHRTDLGREMK